MTKLTISAVFLMSLTLCRAETPNPADYSVAVHVQSSRLNGSGAPFQGLHQELSATIDGKHYELQSWDQSFDVLRTGDYKAKLIKKEEARPYEYEWIYQFLFADGKTRNFLVVGEDQ
jgi:hypothetical protein